MYKASELRLKSKEELLKLVSELKGKLLALRFEAATGQLTETHLPSRTKKDIALIFTVLKEKEKGILIPEKNVVSKPQKPTIEKNVKVETNDSKTTSKKETSVKKTVSSASTTKTEDNKGDSK